MATTSSGTLESTRDDHLRFRRRPSIFAGVLLIFLGLFAGGSIRRSSPLGAALLFGAGLFQTIDNRRAVAMIALITILAIALMPVAIIALLVALFAAILASVAESDLGLGLFADRDGLVTVRAATCPSCG